MRVIFLGSADFGLPALNYLHERHTLAAVVSTPPRPSGRGLKMADSPVVLHMKKFRHIPVLTPESLHERDFIATLRSFCADCFIVAAFRLLPRQLFSLPPFGTLNIHASLLPAFRGPAPIHRAIEAGEKRTGITVFRIDEGIDTGEILMQETMDIGEEETTPQLYERLSARGAAVLEKTLAALEKGICVPQLQDGTRSSKAPKLRKIESIIDWSLPSEVLFNKIKAFKPFPGTVTFTDTGRLGIEWGYPIRSDDAAASCGTIVEINDDGFDVQTGHGLLRVISVKPEGRKIMTAGDFIRGSVIRKGHRFHE